METKKPTSHTKQENYKPRSHTRAKGNIYILLATRLQEVERPRSPETEKPGSQGNQEAIQEQKARFILHATRLQEVEGPRSPETEKPRSQGNQEASRNRKPRDRTRTQTKKKSQKKIKINKYASKGNGALHFCACRRQGVVSSCTTCRMVILRNVAEASAALVRRRLTTTPLSIEWHSTQKDRFLR